MRELGGGREREQGRRERGLACFQELPFDAVVDLPCQVTTGTQSKSSGARGPSHALLTGHESGRFGANEGDSVTLVRRLDMPVVVTGY